MKTLLLLTICTLLLSSCEKDNSEIRQFYGTWEMRSSIGFMSSRNYEPGNGTLIELKSDGTMNRYENAVLKLSEKFKIASRTISSCKWDTKEYWSIEYASGSHDQIRSNSDTLKISTPPCWEDGGTVTYVRVNK